MQTLFDSAGLAIVAYVEVLADGTSPNTNSGVTTAKTATGRYTITLPSDKAQGSNKDLIFIQPTGVASGVPVTSRVDDTTSQTVKSVELTNGTTPTDNAFSAIILRTITPTPAGAPS